jgi:hypothetical protein
MCALSDDPAKSSVVLDRELEKEKDLGPSGPSIRVRCVVGRPARTTAGLVAAAMSGIRSTREECARRACTSGLQHSVSLAAAGHRTPTGMRNHEIQSYCVRVHSRSVNEELKIASGL